MLLCYEAYSIIIVLLFLSQAACQMFEKISERAREELKVLKIRQVASFQKSLSELAELELKHSRAHAQLLKATLGILKADL